MTKKKHSPKIDLAPGFKLSESFANSRDHHKVVEVDRVLAFVISGGVRGTPSVTPLYRADVHIKTTKGWCIVPSYEHGARLHAYTFLEDYEGCAFAQIAWSAVSALEERRLAAATSKKPRGKKGR